MFVKWNIQIYNINKYVMSQSVFFSNGQIYFPGRYSTDPLQARIYPPPPSNTYGPKNVKLITEKLSY